MGEAKKIALGRSMHLMDVLLGKHDVSRHNVEKVVNEQQMMRINPESVEVVYLGPEFKGSRLQRNPYSEKLLGAANEVIEL